MLTSQVKSTLKPLPLAISTIAFTFGSAGAAAYNTDRIEDPDVRACADRALPNETASQLQRVKVIGKNGHERDSLREIMWKRSDNNDSRVLVRMLEPIDDKGVAILVNDDAERSVVSYMMYSPKIKRVRRVTGDSFFGSIMRTDFTYDDFRYFYSVDEQEEVVRVEDAVLDDMPAYVLETTRPDDNGIYSKVRFFVDKEVCLPVRTEFLGLNGELRKELIADREHIKPLGERFVPHKVTMRDLKLESISEFQVEEVEIDPDLDDSMFEVSTLKRGGH